MKLLTLMLVAAVLFGVFGTMAAKARAQEPGDGSQEHEGRPEEPPPYPEDLLREEDRPLTENEEPLLGTYTQAEESGGSLSMPFIAKVSIVIVVLIVALIVIVLRKSAVPMS